MADWRAKEPWLHRDINGSNKAPSPTPPTFARKLAGRGPMGSRTTNRKGNVALEGDTHASPFRLSLPLNPLHQPPRTGHHQHRDANLNHIAQHKRNRTLHQGRSEAASKHREPQHTGDIDREIA